MKLIISCVFSLFTLTSLFSQEISGSWQGILEIQGTNLEIVFHIEKQANNFVSTMDSPTQGAFGIATTKTSFDNDKLQIIVSNLGIFYQATLKSDSLFGTFNQNGLPFPLTLVRTEKKTQLRPQEPKEPYPYKVEEVVFTNLKEKIDLSATLTLPKEKEKSPAVVLIAGSGPNDRDETVFGHKPFWVLADYLTRNGIAVLRFDKRGTGESGGEYFTATTQDFADDAEAALNYLKKRREIDTSNLGLIGHSEGGIIAPIIAARNNDVKFIVLMAGLGVSGAELSLAQNQFAFNKTSISEREKEDLDKILRSIYESVTNWSEYVGSNEERDTLKKELGVLWENLPQEIQPQVKKDVFVEKTTSNIASPWFRSFLKTDPLVYLEKVSIPVLAINGENDTQVEYQTNLNKIEAALKKANNKHYTVKSYPQLNHLFQESTTGELDEYGKIEQTISPDVLSDITNWILEQVK
ncbi:MAG: alpha/beta fold hydrolase [Dysgonamonadaceae bacterium]|nr:alpha/beta fold hydrolase [Dysgonamonadaceae bacterium]